MSNSKIGFKKYLGIAAGFPSKSQSEFRISISCFGLIDDDKLDAIMKIRNNDEQFKKMGEAVFEAIKSQDPKLIELSRPNVLTPTGTSCFLGDPEDELEDFMSEHEDELNDFLDDQELECLGCIVVSRFKQDADLDKMPFPTELLDHINKHYYAVPS